MKYIYLVLFVLSFTSCTSTASKEGSEERPTLLDQQNMVEVQILEETIFPKHLLSNGKLRALRKSELKFNVPGKIKKLNVRNGNKVRAGEVIARLEPFEYRRQLQSARTAFEKAQLDLQDILIGQGYDLADSASISPAIFHAASIRSGYTAAKGQLEEARFKLRSTVLKAPFDGLVANLKQRLFETANTSETFCMVIDDSKFEVEFQLVESEIADVRVDDPVKVMPYALNREYEGRITVVNPVIDEHGLITVKAVIDNSGELLEGMNVEVTVEKEVPGQMVVPKAAVVLRQNQEVLFKYVNGKAYWTYVKTGLENSDSYTVQAHPDKGGSLQPGDTIIISGNLNLAHESSVVVE